MTVPAGTISSMEVSEHIAALQREGSRLGDAAQRAGLTADVPSCPAWQMRDLLRHISYVHRWAAAYVTEQRRDPVPDRRNEPQILAGGPPDDELLDWYRAGHAALVTALTDADPGLECYAFLPASSPRAFWARRQAHETAIHRVDAELATAQPTPFRSRFADDGIDELIMGFFGRDPAQMTEAQRHDGRISMQVTATDTGNSWLIRLTSSGALAAEVQRGTGSADCQLIGPAAGLYLALWNRAEPSAAEIQVSGDEIVLEKWRDGMRVTWA
jgi:uncharacterized protein (TIGR03083 family)